MISLGNSLVCIAQSICSFFAPFSGFYIGREDREFRLSSLQIIPRNLSILIKDLNC